MMMWHLLIGHWVFNFSTQILKSRPRTPLVKKNFRLVWENKGLKDFLELQMNLKTMVPSFVLGLYFELYFDYSFVSLFFWMNMNIPRNIPSQTPNTPSFLLLFGSKAPLEYSSPTRYDEEDWRTKWIFKSWPKFDP